MFAAVVELLGVAIAGGLLMLYWRRIVLLTVFRKTKMRETEQIERAHRAQKECEASHPPAHTTWSR